jgi:DNA-binding transcriptional ArsR family regulator
LLTLMRAIDEGDAVERLKAMVDGWRRNALEALAAHDYRADVDTYLEVSVDARLSLLARPALRRHVEDLEDEDDACLDEVSADRLYGFERFILQNSRILSPLRKPRQHFLGYCRLWRGGYDGGVAYFRG